MNPFNQMFNNEYIQQQAARAHEQQIENVLKSAQKLKDFLKVLKISSQNIKAKHLLYSVQS